MRLFPALLTAGATNFGHQEEQSIVNKPCQRPLDCQNADNSLSLHTSAQEVGIHNTELRRVHTTCTETEMKLLIFEFFEDKDLFVALYHYSRLSVAPVFGSSSRWSNKSAAVVWRSLP